MVWSPVSEAQWSRGKRALLVGGQREPIPKIQNPDMKIPFIKCPHAQKVMGGIKTPAKNNLSAWFVENRGTPPKKGELILGKRYGAFLGQTRGKTVCHYATRRSSWALCHPKVCVIGQDDLKWHHLVVGQKWVPKMEPWQMETWTTTCGPLLV